MEKKWYHSKTLWVNAIALAALVVQGLTGWIISPEYQAAALTGINTVLRIITKSELTA